LKKEIVACNEDVVVVVAAVVVVVVAVEIRDVFLIK